MNLMGAHIHQDNFSWSKMRNRAKTAPKVKDNSVEPIETGNCGKNASIRQAAERRGGEKAGNHSLTLLA